MTVPRSSYGFYVVEAVLGHGAMGTVYLARDSRIGRRVALKTIQLAPHHVDESTGDGQFFARLQREAEMSGSLNHPNITTLYEAGYEDGRISYLAMEYIEGESLQLLLKKRGVLGIGEALEITSQILRGLAFAHEKGIIHRDIKPANILLNAEGQVKIADFGIARPSTATSNLTKAGMLMGTPSYMAPEQVTGAKLTPLTDLFSTGVVMYQMLSGAKPFAGADIAEIFYKIVHQKPIPMREIQASVPDSVALFVVRMMAKDPSHRFQSAAEALADLETIVEGYAETGPSTLPSATLLTQGGNRKRFNSAIPTRVFYSIALAAAATLLVVGGAISRHINADPTVEIPPQKIEEFEEKRRMLQAADAFYATGHYEASAEQYEVFLRRWPDSPAAREGLLRARRAQGEEFEVVEQRGDSTSTASKSAGKKKKEEDWLLQRLRKLRDKVVSD